MAQLNLADWGSWFDRAWKVGGLVLGIAYLYFKQHTDAEISKLGQHLRVEMDAIRVSLAPLDKRVAMSNLLNRQTVGRMDGLERLMVARVERLERLVDRFHGSSTRD